MDASPLLGRYLQAYLRVYTASQARSTSLSYPQWVVTRCRLVGIYLPRSIYDIAIQKNNIVFFTSHIVTFFFVFSHFFFRVKKSQRLQSSDIWGYTKAILTKDEVIVYGEFTWEVTKYREHFSWKTWREEIALKSKAYVYVSIILKYIYRIRGVIMRTGFKWPRIRLSGGLLWTR
jgi:hypothetical protein